MCKAKNKINEKDLLKFLKFSYFGDLSNPIQAASKRAYRDMNRTIRFNELSTDEIRLELREKVNNIFEIEIKKLTENNITSQEEFDLWHCKVCGNIKDLYEDNDIKFTYGQAQKWVNMTIKYLYILNEHTFDNVFDFLHIPVDNYIFKAVKEKLGIDKPKNPWSKLDETEYLNYQNDIRKKLKEEEKYISPLDWEFKIWLDKAQEVKK